MAKLRRTITGFPFLMMIADGPAAKHTRSGQAPTAHSLQPGSTARSQTLVYGRGRGRRNGISRCPRALAGRRSA